MCDNPFNNHLHDFVGLKVFWAFCADYYSEQKKLEAKELRREAQAKQTEFDVAAKKVAENGLVKTLGMVQF